MTDKKKQHGRAAAQRRAAAAAARAEADRRQRRLRVIVLGVVLIVAVLGGLLASIAGGDDDDPAAATTTTSTTAEPTTSVPPADFVDPEGPGAAKPDERPAGFTGPPPSCLTEGVDYSAVMVTSEGEVTIDLLEAEAPNTVNNFVFLARWGWYDGDDFHRVIQGFMNQGGDPIADGSGNPGYAIDDELPASVDEYVPGAVAMANSGPNTNGSQFFICVGCQQQLGTPAYSLFGRVTSGMEVVEAINALGVPPGQSGPPTPPVTIESVTIVEG